MTAMQSMGQALKRIREQYYLPEEFPLLPRDRFPLGSLQSAMHVDSSDLEQYAKGLGGKDLEGLMQDLVHSFDPREIGQAVTILTLRSTKRIRTLASFLCQYHDNSQGIRDLCKGLRSSMAESQADETPFLWRFGDSDTKARLIQQVIQSESQDVTSIFTKYQIQERSPLAREALLHYFATCDKTGFLINHSRVKAVVDEFPTHELTQVITNYLSSLFLVELHDDVNRSILEKLGEPLGSMEWDPYPAELRRKFSQWTFLNSLKNHTREQPAKFRSLAAYYNLIQRNYMIPEVETMVLEFGDIIVADRRYSSDSVLYSSKVFDRELALWREDPERQPSFLDEKNDLVTARQFMIMGLEDDIIRIQYDGIHRYFLEELMEIKLGLEPDMRRLRSKRKLKHTSVRHPLPREQQ